MLFNAIVKRLPIKAKKFVLHYLSAVSLCLEYGETPTPSAVRFVWEVCEPDWESASQSHDWQWGKI